MKKNVVNAIEEYQCPGCVCGYNVECYEKSEDLACKKHCAGTTIIPVVGRIFLGMPKGFNRLGSIDDMVINIFENVEDGWGFDNLNVPVWKYLDGEGNTLVRGFSPRINKPFLHIYLGDHMKEIDCLDIKNDLNGMD